MNTENYCSFIGIGLDLFRLQINDLKIIVSEFWLGVILILNKTIRNRCQDYTDKDTCYPHMYTYLLAFSRLSFFI